MSWATHSEDELGRIAYNAYCASCGGVSVRGESLPQWVDQSAPMKRHWTRAALAVASALVNIQQR